MARIRLVLACEPLLLQELLTTLLGERPDIELLDRDATTADIVLVCASASNSGWPADLPPAAATAPRLIALDPIRNLVRVRVRREGPVVEQQFGADAATVVDALLQAPRAHRWQHPATA